MSIRLLELDLKRRDAVLNAALKEFVQKGFDRASTNVIAKEAGISKPLMFHYVSSKQDLFLFVYDYFNELLDKEYYTKMDFTEKDIFARLRQSYLLQLSLLLQYPYLLEIENLHIAAKSAEINKALEERARKKQASCTQQIFDEIDVSRFRDGLDIETCKQFILWTNIGFTNQILDGIKKSNCQTFDSEQITAQIDGYLGELRNVFYE